MRHALALHDPEQWLEGDDAEIIAANDGPFKHHLDRYKYPDRHGSDPDAHRAAALALLDPLEQRLARSANLCGEGRTLTDIAVMPFVRQFAAVDRDWFEAQALPGVQRWLRDHVASPLFVAAMARPPA